VKCNPNKFRYLVQVAACVVLAMSVFNSCEEDPVNPFDPFNNTTVDTTGQVNIDPNSIEGLHKNVFKPVCANSGCHDGNFEPDYRTIEGTYNTLVYHSIVKNDSVDLLQYRVEPFNHQRSMLYRRLTVDLGGNSGIMPLVVEPGTDWLEKKNEYLTNIQNWINDGAKDLFGNVADRPNRKPQMAGFIGYDETGALLDRAVSGSVFVGPGVTEVNAYISLVDAETPSDQLELGELELSLSRDFYEDSVNNQSFTIQTLSTPRTELGYSGVMVQYYHRIHLADPANLYSPGEVVFARFWVKAPVNDTLQVPGIESAHHLKLYFSFELSD